MTNFQSIVPNQLAQAAVGVTKSTIYTVPASTRTIVKDIDVANNTAASINITVYLVNSGGTAGDGSNTLLPALTVPAYSTLQWSGSQVLAAAGTIVAVASATGCSITVSGGEGT